MTELEDAAAWYARERDGYGALFVSEVQRAVERAADLPRSGTPIPGIDPGRDVRSFVVRRFPFAVITAVLAGERAVVAVADSCRR